MITWVCMGLLVLGYPLVWWLRGRNNRALFQGAHRALLDQNAALGREVERAREEAQAERDKSSRYFIKISDFEQERTKWQNLYTQQSIGHGNAQNLMMRTIEDFARRLQAHNVKVVVPKVLSTIRAEFAASHEVPARQIEEALKAARAKLETGAPAAPETP